MGGGDGILDGGHVITVERLMPVMPFLRRDIHAILMWGRRLGAAGDVSNVAVE